MINIHAPVLIIGYQRPENIRKIVEICVSAGVEKIYLSIDYPKNNDANSYENYNSVLRIQDSFKDASIVFEINTYHANIGCSAHVVSACDWVFMHEEQAIILEDDCLPSIEFFKFCSFYFSQEFHFENLVLASGSQFAPNPLGIEHAVFSKYALIWGWATTKRNWARIRPGIIDSRLDGWKILEFNEENVYWHEGSRRARAGFVDAWDTPLVNYIFQSGYFTLAPRNNLVSNVGDDSVATHTSTGSSWIRKETGKFTEFNASELALDVVNDEYLKRKFYRIRKRHLISTRITRLKDSWSCKERISLAEAVNRAKRLQIE